MPGFLDQLAPSIEAEYSRYLEGDVLGKILFKNFLVNVAGVEEEDLQMPISRYGDVNIAQMPKADALVKVGDKWLDVEVKCARINIANKTLGYTRPNWAFNNILRTPKKVSKNYDLLFAVGIEILGFEQPGYWEHFDRVVKARKSRGIDISIESRPHEATYLNLCGFFIFPFHQIPQNHFRLMVDRIATSPLRQNHAWGFENDRLMRLWNNCTKLACSV